MRARTVSAVRPSPPRLGVRVRAVLSTRQRGVECSHLDCADGPAGSGLVIAVQGPGGIAFPANGARLAAAGLRRPGAQPDSCALSCAVRSCQACRSAGPRPALGVFDNRRLVTILNYLFGEWPRLSALFKTLRSLRSACACESDPAIARAVRSGRPPSSPRKPHAQT